MTHSTDKPRGSWTVAELRKHAEFIRECMFDGQEGRAVSSTKVRWNQQRKAADAMDAFADMIERAQTGVTESVVQTYQVAEMQFGEEMQRCGVLFDPALAVEHALKAVWPAAAEPMAKDTPR